MNVYILVNQMQILNILSYKMLHLQDKTIYSRIPKYMNDYIYILCIQLNRSEKNLLIKLAPSVYSLNKTLDLDSRQFTILCQNKATANTLENLQLKYREIKSTNNMTTKIYFNEKQFIPSNTHYDVDDFILEYENQKQLRLNKIKGMTFGLAYEYTLLQNYIINRYPVYFSELKQITDIMNNLRSNHMLTQNLYTKFKSLQAELNYSANKILEEIDRSKILFSYNENKSIILNNNSLYSLSDIELNIFQNILNKLIASPDNSKDFFATTVLSAINSFSNHSSSEFVYDAKIVIDRIKNSDYTTNIRDIHTPLIKNIYALYANFDTINNLPQYLNDNNISHSFISYSLYGAIKGFSALPNSFTLMQATESWAYEFIKSSLTYTEKEFSDISYNITYTRNKLNYYINELSKKLYLLSNLNSSSLSIKVTKHSIKTEVLLNHTFYGKMIINIYSKIDNLSKSANYFNHRINHAKFLYKHMEINHNVYYLFSTQPNKNIKMKNINAEYFYSIIIAKLLKNLEVR